MTLIYLDTTDTIWQVSLVTYKGEEKDLDNRQADKNYLS